MLQMLAGRTRTNCTFFWARAEKLNASVNAGVMRSNGSSASDIKIHVQEITKWFTRHLGKVCGWNCYSSFIRTILLLCNSLSNSGLFAVSRGIIIIIFFWTGLRIHWSPEGHEKQTESGGLVFPGWTRAATCLWWPDRSVCFGTFALHPQDPVFFLMQIPFSWHCSYVSGHFLAFQQ